MKLPDWATRETRDDRTIWKFDMNQIPRCKWNKVLRIIQKRFKK